eukprot:4873491-Pleurochrysis_carterae.AAC.2
MVTTEEHVSDVGARGLFGCRRAKDMPARRSVARERRLAAAAMAVLPAGNATTAAMCAEISPISAKHPGHLDDTGCVLISSLTSCSLQVGMRLVDCWQLSLLLIVSMT